MGNPFDVTGQLGSDQMGGKIHSQEPIVNKCVKIFFVFLSQIENSCTDGSNYVPILAAAVGFFSTNDL